MLSKEIFVSFIIPVYNAEKYLERCLSSVSALKSINIEIIIVDDGSTDKSFLIYERYASNDERISLIKKENGGVSSARNIGIKSAKGKWITFVDSDDEIVPEVYDAFFQQIDMTAELWILGLALRSSKIDVPGQKVIKGAWAGKDIELIKRSLFCDIAGIKKKRSQGFNFTGPYAKFFQKQIIVENSILFPEDIVVGEDSIFVYCYLNYVKKIFYTNRYGYYYWQNGSSVMHQFQKGKGERFLHTVWKIKEILGNDGLSDYWQCAVRYYLHALKMDWCNSDNTESYFVRKREAIRWRNEPFMIEAFCHFKFSRIRWEAIPIALCAKKKWFFMCNLLLKGKEKLPIRF